MDSSRRRFLGHVTAAAAAAAGLAACRPADRPADTPTDRRQQALDVLARTPAFDLHAHPGLFPRRGTPAYGGDAGFDATMAAMEEGRLSGAFLSLVSDINLLVLGADGVRVTRTFEAGEAWADYERQRDALKVLLAGLPASPATRVAGLDAAHEAQAVAPFIACEGGGCLEEEPGRLERMYADGVRSVQLVHYAPNALGDLQTQPPRFDGLSPIGHEVVREMNRLGIVIDVAHASFATVRDVVEATDAPILLSHSHLQTDTARHPRLITPEHARLVANTGGVIGMWPSGFANVTFADFVANTLRLVDAVGVAHVGLGTDMDGNYQPVFDDYRQLPVYAEALLAEGLTPGEVGQIVGGNARRVLRAVVG